MFGSDGNNKATKTYGGTLILVEVKKIQDPMLFLFHTNYIICSLDDRERGSVGQTTHVAAFGKTDETRFTPSSSPRVLDLPGSRVRTDEQDTVVELGEETTAGKDASGVKLPFASVDGDGDGSFAESRSQSTFTLGDIGKTGDRGNRAGSFAGTVDGPVWIGRFRSNSTVGMDPLESIVHQASVATLVSIRTGAIYQLLLGQRHKTVSSKEFRTFDSSSGGERPARTALTLVLDSGDGTLGGPVNIFEKLNVRQVGFVARFKSFVTGKKGQVLTFELSSGQVSELSHSHGPGFSFGVVGIHGFQVLRKNAVAVEKFFNGICFTMISHKLGKFVLTISLGESTLGDDSNSSEKGKDQIGRAHV